MAGDRTLKLSILADVSNLAKELNKGSKDVEGFGTQIADISAKAVKAFAAIGVAIGGVSLAFAKAAAEDEAAANRLADTIGAVTSATDDQIKAVENYITTTALATGVTDDQLRPAYARLIRSTKDTEDATKLLNLALDLSAATGKPLETVVAALGRAYDGNTTALGKLGLGIDQGLIKSKDFNAIYTTLNSTFGEFSEKRSEEAIVKFQRLQVALDESKEAVGAALLPAFEALGDWILNEGVPRLNAFIAGLTGDKSLTSSFTSTQKKAEEFGGKVRGVINTFIEYKDVVIAAAALTATVFVVSKIAAGVQATIMLIKGLIGMYNALRVSAMAAGIASAFALNPALGLAAAAASIGVMGLIIQQLEKQNIGGISPSEFTKTGLDNGIQFGGGGVAGGGGSVGGGGGTFTGGTVTGGTITGGGTAKGGGSVSTDTSKTDGSVITDWRGTTREAWFDPYNQQFSDVIPLVPGVEENVAVSTTTPVSQIVVNVNAPSIIDKNGFTAAVVDALNETQRRSGAGGGQLLI